MCTFLFNFIVIVSIQGSKITVTKVLKVVLPVTNKKRDYIRRNLEMVVLRMHTDR